MSVTRGMEHTGAGHAHDQQPDGEVRIVDHRGATTLAAGGLTASAVGLLGFIAIDPGAAPSVAPPLVLAGVGALLSWRFGRWSKAVAALVGLMLLSIGGPQMVGNGLLRLDSFFDLVPGVTALSGALLGVVGGLLGVGGREGVPGSAVLRVAGSLLVVVAIVSAVVSFSGGSELAAVERADAREVVLVDSDFAPSELTVPAGEEIAFAVRNDGRVLHTFTVDELGIDVMVPPGREVLVTGTAPAPGAYVFYCAPHSRPTDAGREGMVGSLAVEG